MLVHLFHGYCFVSLSYTTIIILLDFNTHESNLYANNNECWFYRTYLSWMYSLTACWQYAKGKSMLFCNSQPLVTRKSRLKILNDYLLGSQLASCFESDSAGFLSRVFLSASKEYLIMSRWKIFESKIS